MKAARFHGNKDIRVEEVPRPKCGPGQVLIDIAWAGICGSDLSEYTHGPGIIPTEGNPHPTTHGFLPIVLGHEFAGRIAETCPGSKFKVGQPVMVDPRLYCADCPTCKSTATNRCPSWGFIGLSGGENGGGLSETAAVLERMVYVLPESIPLEIAVLIEPLTVVYHAIKISGLESFDGLSVLILGGGPIGVAMVYALRAHGCRAVYVSEPTSTRRKQIEKLADAVFDPIKESVSLRCRELTKGRGVDVAFDCAGVQVALDNGADSLRLGGLCVVVAGWVKDAATSQALFMLKELTLKWSFSYDDSDFSKVVEAFKAGKFAGVDNMVTSRIFLDDVVKLGFEELIQKKDDHVKIIVTPQRALMSVGK